MEGGSVNNSIAKLFRKIASASGTFNKPLYKSLKKEYQSGPYAHFSTQQFLDKVNQEQQLKENQDET